MDKFVIFKLKLSWGVKNIDEGNTCKSSIMDLTIEICYPTCSMDIKYELYKSPKDI